MNTRTGKKLLIAFAAGSFAAILHPVTVLAQLKERPVVVTTQKSSEMDEATLRKRMKDDGVSDPVIDKLLAQRKEWMKKGKTVNWTNAKNAQTPVTHASCGALGAESGWGAWSGAQGDNSGYPPSASNITWSAPSNPPPAGLFSITSGTGIDPNTPSAGNPSIPVVCPGFGSHSIVLNQSCTTSWVCEQLTYPLTVTVQDTNFIYAYALVIEDAGHSQADQPFVQFSIYDSNGNTIPCSNFHYTGGPNIPGFYPVSGGGCGIAGLDQYKPWTLVGINLSAYVGQTINIVIINADCDQGGHFAYSYWDFMCNSLAGSSSNFCQGQPASICAPADPNIAYTYQWYLNGTAISAPQGTQACITPTVIPGDTFSVAVHQPSGCDFHEKFAPQQISIQPGFKDSLHCNNVYFYDTTIVTNSSTSGWNWNFGDASTHSTSQNPTHIYSSAGTYTVSLIVTCAAGCKDTVQHVLTILPFPTVNAGPNISICPGNTTTLCASSSSGSMAYVWQPSNQTTTCIVANSASAFTYTVTGTSPTGCVANKTVSVAVITPTITATGGSFCTNNINCTTLTATGGAAYSWSPATGLSNPSISNPVACPSITTTYTVVGTDTNGCSNTAVATITAYAPPIVTVGPTSTICTGQSTVVLTANSNNPFGSSFLWSPTTGLSCSTCASPVANPPSSTTYTVTATDTHGCAGSANVSVTVGVIPAITTSPASTICYGQSTTILTSSSNPSGISYVWSPSAGLTCSTCANTPANPPTSTNYTITITDALGCHAAATVPITVGVVPNVTAGPASTICLGKTTVNLWANSNPAGAYYSWTPTTGLSNSTISNPNANPPSSQTYSVTVTTALGCTAISSVPVKVGAIPVISAIASTTVCTGDSAQLSASANTGLQPYAYYWSPPNDLSNASSPNPHAAPVLTTTYVATVTDANGCTADTSTIVFVQSIPSVTWAKWTPTLTCDGYVIILKANVSSNGQTLYWDFGDGSNTTIYPPNDTTTHTYPYNGTYNISVTVTNAPCKSVLDTILNVGDISAGFDFCAANVFSPNGDGKNECFHPAFMDPLCGCKAPCIAPASVDADFLKQCISLEVYDRWGINVFKSSDNQKCWDGNTKNGSPAREGTYYYISTIGPKTIKGYVELMR